MSNYDDLKRKALRAHETINETKNMMFILQVAYKRLRYILDTSEPISKQELNSVIDDMDIMSAGVKLCIDECSSLYTSISNNKEVQELCGFDGEQIQSDSNQFISVTSKFISDLQIIIEKGRQKVKEMN